MGRDGKPAKELVHGKGSKGNEEGGTEREGVHGRRGKGNEREWVGGSSQGVVAAAVAKPSEAWSRLAGISSSFRRHPLSRLYHAWV